MGGRTYGTSLQPSGARICSTAMSAWADISHLSQYAIGAGAA
jgi:hypothetical protein